MKQAIIILIVMMFSTAAFAQPPNERRLKNDLTRLTKRVEKLKKLEFTTADNRNERRVARAIETTERYLNTFKEKYPTHNVSNLENDINEFKKGQAKALASRDNKVGKIDTLSEIVKETDKFRIGFRGYFKSDKDVVKVKKQLQTFENLIQTKITPDLLKIAQNDTNRDVIRAKKKAQGSARLEKTRIPDGTVKFARQNRDKYSVTHAYYQLKFAIARLKVFDKLFPNDTDIQASLRRVNEMSAQLGSVESLQKRADKNEADRLASIKMIPAKHNNTRLSATFKRVFTSRGFGKGGVLKINLLSTRWKIIRNKLTGRVLKRTWFAQIAAKESNGKCMLYNYTIQQEYVGSKFGRAFEYAHLKTQILCSNVPK